MDLRKMRKAADNRLPRATCPLCRREVAVRNGGELREHRPTPTESGPVCRASGLTLERAEGLASRSLVDRVSDYAEEVSKRGAELADTLDDLSESPHAAMLERSKDLITDQAAAEDRPIAEVAQEFVDMLASHEPDQEPPAMLGTSYAILPLAAIEPDPQNRDLGDLSELVDSIRARGILEPILVEADVDASVSSDNGSGWRYRLVAGERRLRAAQEAGLLAIPALIRPALEGHDGEVARRIDQTVENLQRKDLTPLEEAKQFGRLRELGLTQEQIARQVGVAQGTVSKRLALVKLPPAVQEAIATGDVSLETAQKLSTIRSAKVLRELYEEASAEAEPGTPWTLDRMLSDAANDVILEAEQEAAKAKARKDLEASGKPTVDSFAHALNDKGPRLLGSSYGKLPLRPKAHEAEPCHAYYLDVAGKIRPVCTETKRHNKRGASELKAVVVGRERQPAVNETPEAKAKRLQKENHLAAIATAHEGREAFLIKLLKRKVDREDLAELVVADLLADTRGLSSHDTETVAEFVGLGDLSVVKATAALAELARSPAERDRVALGALVVSFELELRVNEWNLIDYRGRVRAWGRVDRYFAWLEAKGYELSAAERAQIAGELLEMPETQESKPAEA